MNRVVLMSLSPRQQSGGVARWVNDFFAAFPEYDIVHFNISDLFSRFGWRELLEWDAAAILGRYLIQHGMIKHDDTLIVDGFWGIGIPPGPNVISVCHGTWARRVKHDLDKGIPSEFPEQMQVQKRYWDQLVANGGKIVSVSEFAQNDLKETWGLESVVINNAIDEKIYSPRPRLYRKRPIIIHGATSKVKAAEHIKYIINRMPDTDIWLLDEAENKLNMPKYEALAQADVVVIPSHYEGNSYFTLEALSVDVPIVCYDVGMPWWASKNGWQQKVGRIIPYEKFSPEETFKAVRDVLSESKKNFQPRELAALFTLERFRSEWKTYLENRGNKC